ncbi:MAG: hypothetical protein ACRED9_02460 [Caulobacteraceae bacterium]
MNRGRIFLACLAASLLTAGGASAAQKLDDQQLSDVRAGFLSAGGFNFDFGATVSTYLDGTMILRSTLAYTPQGAVTAQTGGAGGPLSAAQNNALGLGTLSKGSYAATDKTGQAVALQSLSSSSVLNMLIFTGSNQTVQVNTAITLTLHDFPQLQQNAATTQFVTGLESALAAVGAKAAGH